MGLDEYETRTWAGWHHHVALCLLAGAFLLSLQQAWGEKDAPDHPSAGLPGGAECCPGSGWVLRSCYGAGSGATQRAGQPLSRETPR